MGAEESLQTNAVEVDKRENSLGDGDPVRDLVPCPVSALKPAPAADKPFHLRLSPSRTSRGPLPTGSTHARSVLLLLLLLRESVNRPRANVLTPRGGFCSVGFDSESHGKMSLGNRNVGGGSRD